MIGGRKVRSNKGKKRVAYGPRSRTRSGAKFRGRKVTKSRKTRKVRSNKGKSRTPYGRRYNSSGRTRSGAKFRGGGPHSKGSSRVSGSMRGSMRGRSGRSVKGHRARKSRSKAVKQQAQTIYDTTKAAALAKIAEAKRRSNNYNPRNYASYNELRKRRNIAYGAASTAVKKGKKQYGNAFPERRQNR